MKVKQRNIDAFKRVLPIVFLFSIVLLGSCHSPSKTEFIEFPVSKTLTLEEFDVSDMLAIPGEITIYKDMVVVWNQETDWFFKIYSLENFDYLGSLIRRGRGPEEEIEISPFIKTIGEDTILYQGSSTVNKARILKLQEDLYLEVLEEYTLPDEMYDDTDIFMVNNNLYASYGMRHFTRDFQGFSPQTGKLFEGGDMLPLNKPQFFSPDELFVLTKHTTVKPDNKYLATAYALLPVIRIYDAESGQLYSEMYMADASKNKQILTNDSPIKEGLINYYFRIKSTNEFIYALYSGKLAGLPEFSEIHIWDWEGNPILHLELEKPFISFDVTADNRFIVASSLFETDKLFRAEIPWD